MAMTTPASAPAGTITSPTLSLISHVSSQSETGVEGGVCRLYVHLIPCPVMQSPVRILLLSNDPMLVLARGRGGFDGPLVDLEDVGGNSTCVLTVHCHRQVNVSPARGT